MNTDEIVAIEQPAGTHLAQLNIARALDDVESARLADFMAALDRINAVAERSRGFVWRLKDGSGNATDITLDDDPRMIVNMSVWTTPEHLENFVWKTVHKQVYGRKAEWFERMAQPHFVMWWIPEGHTPSLDEAVARLEKLRASGPTAEAFGWESLPNIRLWMNQQCA